MQLLAQNHRPTFIQLIRKSSIFHSTRYFYFSDFVPHASLSVTWLVSCNFSIPPTWMMCSRLLGVLYRITCLLTDTGMHGTMRDLVRTKLDNYSCREIPEIRKLAGNTSAGTWRHTLWMSAVPDDAATASRLLGEDERRRRVSSSGPEVTPLVVVGPTQIWSDNLWQADLFTHDLSWQVLASVWKSHRNVIQEVEWNPAIFASTYEW